MIQFLCFSHRGFSVRSKVLEPGAKIDFIHNTFSDNSYTKHAAEWFHCRCLIVLLPQKKKQGLMRPINATIITQPPYSNPACLESGMNHFYYS